MTQPPDTVTSLLTVSVIDADPVAAADITKVVAFVMETTYAPDGIPVPDRVCPTPISDVDVTVTVVVPLVVAARVKTPTCDIVVPDTAPNKTGVFTELSMDVRFCPGCATSVSRPFPPASYTVSNCHKLLSFAVKLDSVKSIIPAPTPS